MPESPGIITSRMASRGGLASNDCEAAAPSWTGLDVVPGLGQLEHDEVADVPVVVGDQDTVGLHRAAGMAQTWQLLRCSRVERHYVKQLRRKARSD